MPQQPSFAGPNGSFAATRSANVTASDTTVIEPLTRGISFGTAGALAVEYPDGVTHTIPSGALAAGIIHPMQVRRVLATGTSAASIVAWF